MLTVPLDPVYVGATQDLLVSDVNDNYRLFAMQEHLLLTVGNLSDQMLYQVDELRSETSSSSAPITFFPSCLRTPQTSSWSATTAWIARSVASC